MCYRAISTASMIIIIMNEPKKWPNRDSSFKVCKFLLTKQTASMQITFLSVGKKVWNVSSCKEIM